MRYGDDRTYHRTETVNVERDAVSGEVVSVWFRCRTLAFTDTKADPQRVEQMREMYKSHPPLGIQAIDFKDA